MVCLFAYTKSFLKLKKTQTRRITTPENSTLKKITICDFRIPGNQSGEILHSVNELDNETTKELDRLQRIGMNA